MASRQGRHDRAEIDKRLDPDVYLCPNVAACYVDADRGERGRSTRWIRSSFVFLFLAASSSSRFPVGWDHKFPRNVCKGDWCSTFISVRVGWTVLSPHCPLVVGGGVSEQREQRAITTAMETGGKLLQIARMMSFLGSVMCFISCCGRFLQI